MFSQVSVCSRGIGVGVGSRGGSLWSHVLSMDVGIYGTNALSGVGMSRGYYIQEMGMSKGVGVSGTSSLMGVSMSRSGYPGGWVCLGTGMSRWGLVCPWGRYPTPRPDMGPGIPRDTVGKQAGSILLECFLVFKCDCKRKMFLFQIRNWYHSIN